jgi:uncharacterized phage protein (TIGR02218 family)
MRTASPALLALLATGNFVRADIWTITLNGGSVIRWTSHDQPIAWGGNTFARGPIIERSTITEKVGVEVATMNVSISATTSDLINGAPVLAFIAGHGMDGAAIKLERAYAANWSSPIIGTIIRFSGKVTSIGSTKGGTSNLTVSSWLVLLKNSSPRNLFQAGCLRTLYDAGCAVNPASFSSGGTVTVAGQQTFTCGLTGAAGYYSQGRIVFTSGANAGVTRTIKVNDGSGVFTLARPLPAPAAIGDTFTAYAGCDLTPGTCNSKFANLIKFKGTPYVPVPTTALGSAQASVTTGGKG